MRAALAPVLTLVLAATGATAGAGCWTGAPPPPEMGADRAPRRPTLYDRIGGLDAVRAIVDGLLRDLATDDRLDAHFASADTITLRQQLVAWLCAASGGPCRYRGKPLRAAHAELTILDVDFDAFAALFSRAVVRAGVRGRSKVELELLVLRTRKSVVTR